MTSQEGSLLPPNIDEVIFGKEISKSVECFFKKHKLFLFMTLLESEENRFLKHLTLWYFFTEYHLISYPRASVTHP